MYRQEEQKYKQIQSVYAKIITSFTALDSHFFQWFSDRRSVWLRESSRCESIPRNTCSVLTSFLSCRHRLIRHKDIINSWWRAKWWWIIRSLFSGCMSGNKLGSAHHSCLASLLTISCCTVFFTFYRFSIWSVYLLVFFIYHALKGSFELGYYLRKKSACQILIEVAVLKLLVHFCTKKYSTRGALGRFDCEVIRINQ